MTVNLSALAGAGQQFFDNNGNPLSGGKLWSYAAGTTTPQATYSDAAGIFAHTNPIILNSAGRVSSGEIWLTAGSNYKFVLMTDADVALASWDNITGINGTGITSNAVSVSYTANGTGAVEVIAQDKFEQLLNVIDFGADQTGVVDSTTAINNAATEAVASGSTLTAQGTFKISGALNLRNARIDFTSATLVLDALAPQAVIGGSSASTVNPMQQFKRVYRDGGATATPTLRVAGTKDQIIEVGSCDYMQLYADTTAPNAAINGSIAYSTFNLGKVDKLELTNNPANTGSGAGDGGSIQWINENTFNCQRISTLTVSGTYPHNHNKFWAGTFEGGTGPKIDFDTGTSNRVYAARLENVSGDVATFGTDAEFNSVQCTWQSSFGSDLSASPIPYTDNGLANSVTQAVVPERNAITVASANIYDPQWNNRVNYSRLPSLGRIQFSGTTTPIVRSNIIEAQQGDTYSFIANSTGVFRLRIECFDDAGNKLTDPTLVDDFDFISGLPLFWVAGENQISSSSVVGGGGILRTNSRIKFVRLSVHGISISQYATNISVLVKRAFGGDQEFRKTSLLTQDNSINLATGVPTQSIVPQGYRVFDNDSEQYHVAIFALRTATASAALSGATSISVDSATGVEIGDLAAILLDSGDTRHTTVSNVVGTTITLSVGLTGAVAAGNAVYFNRWISIYNEDGAARTVPTLAAGAQHTASITIAGAELGDFVLVSYDQNLQGVTMTGYVSATDTVTIVFYNGTSGSVTITAGSVRVRHMKQ